MPLLPRALRLQALALPLVLACAALVCGCRSQSPEDEALLKKVTPGYVGKIKATGKALLVVAGKTSAEYDAANESLASDKTDGLADMLMARKAFVLEKGTNVEVLGHDDSNVHLRLLSGSEKGKDVWTSPTLID